MQQQASHNHVRPHYNHHDQVETYHSAHQRNDGNLCMPSTIVSFSETESFSSALHIADDEDAIPFHQHHHQHELTSTWHPISKANDAALKPFILHMSTSPSDESSLDTTFSSSRFYYLFKALHWCLRMVIPCFQQDTATDQIRL
ncbi:hypothetical protein EC991_001723 [Linnemannia zychae]|nr:hypothetical protein EC991_001723 [Linnemannia zychae]